MKTIELYLFLFGEYPPITHTMSLDNEIYEELMKNAISSGKKIEPQDLDKALKDYVFDVEKGKNEKSFAKFGKNK